MKTIKDYNAAIAKREQLKAMYNGEVDPKQRHRLYKLLMANEAILLKLNEFNRFDKLKP